MENSTKEMDKFLKRIYLERYKQNSKHFRSAGISGNRMTQILWATKKES